MKKINKKQAGRKPKAVGEKYVAENKLASPYDSDSKDGSDKDYEARDAFDTLMRAEDAKQNPDLMKRVHKHAKRKKRAIRSIEDLRRISNEMALGDDDDDLV
jgi:superfamily II DNA or RNA helicase